MARYGKKSQEMVKDAMHKMKKGKLKSGSGKKVKSKQQAVAIGLSEARSKGGKVPSKAKKGQRPAAKKRGRPAARRKKASRS